jgi:formate hydrogenlyase subunit 6/NADH:ubiquinone oxidoreductase subunit I
VRVGPSERDIDDVLEIRPAADRRLLSLGHRFRGLVHRNRQAYMVKADACTACARCVQACPALGVIKLRRQISA